MDCKDCNGMCCKHVAVELDKPTCKDDFEHLKWYVAHEGVSVWMNDEEEWFVEFTTKCKHLGYGNECKAYDRRPQICRDYDSENCVGPLNDHEAELTFTCMSDVEKYVAKNCDFDED